MSRSGGHRQLYHGPGRDVQQTSVSGSETGCECFSRPNGMNKGLEPTIMEIHLGERTYASFDGHTVWLRTRNGAIITNEIALEPSAIELLVGFLKTLTEGAGDVPTPDLRKRPPDK
ncbi:MAG: hypothetical protein WBX25_31820 [Rhodomicrobium sp.]